MTPGGLAVRISNKTKTTLLLLIALVKAEKSPQHSAGKADPS
jgi:hypothetical protein